MINLPQSFTERLINQLGLEQYNNFVTALEQETPTSIRINPKKLPIALDYPKVSWCNNAYYLSQRPLFVADPLWHAGAYYVQEASSMALEQAFNQIRSQLSGNINVLDLCAAPGGKSTHLASLLNDNDVLVSNEVIQTRVGVLKENLLKWGFPNTIICNNDSKDFAQIGELFDVIVIDAPCSGEGLFRKDPNAIEQWCEDNVNTCELRQKRILQDIIKCVKNNGFIIYSTCTYNPGENQAQVDFLKQNGFSEVSFLVEGEHKSSFQFMPHTHQGEGFFIALLQKDNSTNDTPSIPRNEETIKLEKVSDEWKQLTKNEVIHIKLKNDIVAISPSLFSIYQAIKKYLKIVSVGTTLGTQNQQLIIPSGELVFSQNFNSEHWPKLELSIEQSIQYIAKNALPFSGSNKGYVTLTYKNIPIGLGKFAGNRINNLFPNEWRLRKQIKPNELYSIIP